MRVFLDTNVLVSGFATRGLSADVARLVLADHDLLTSDDVLAETRRVLRDKLGVPADTVKDIERFLRRHHVEPTPEADPPVSVRDPDDETIRAAAIAAEADLLVTGDKDLLDVADQVESLRVMTPRGFWEATRSASG
jgi:putative PIN family toxin of toxin-antitoxin system